MVLGFCDFDGRDLDFRSVKKKRRKMSDPIRDKEIESLKETIEVLTEKTGVRVLKQEISDLTEAVRVMGEALTPFVENYERYGNHFTGTHGMFAKAKQALANPAVKKVVGKC